MITKYTHKIFYSSKANELLTLECEFCTKTFLVTKKRIQEAMASNGRSTCCYCSKSCSAKSRKKIIELECKYCNKKFTRSLTNINKNKTKNYFCSKKCSALFRNKKNS